MLCHPICNWLYVDKVGHSHAVIHTDERGDYIRMRWLWCWCSVDAHIWMSHVAHMNESCRTYEWVTGHIWIRHVTQMNESRGTYEGGDCGVDTVRMRVDDWVMAHIWMSHGTHVNASCHECVWMTEGEYWVCMTATWLIHMRHDSFIHTVTQWCVLNTVMHTQSS